MPPGHPTARAIPSIVCRTRSSASICKRAGCRNAAGLRSDGIAGLCGTSARRWKGKSRGVQTLAGQLSAILNFAPELVTTATLIVDTKGQGFSDITPEAKRFVDVSKAGEGVFFAYLRHTSASLVIQENADRDVQTD